MGILCKKYGGCKKYEHCRHKLCLKEIFMAELDGSLVEKPHVHHSVFLVGGFCYGLNGKYQNP